MAWMREEFRKQGIEIAAIYHCPDHPTAGIGAYRRENSWRKPGPGILLQAAKDLDLAECWCVGDKLTDMEAAQAAEVGMLVLLNPAAVKLTKTEDIWCAPSLDRVFHQARQRASPLAPVFSFAWRRSSDWFHRRMIIQGLNQTGFFASRERETAATHGEY